MKTWKFFGILVVSLLSPITVAAQHGDRRYPQPYCPPIPCPPGSGYTIAPPVPGERPPVSATPGQETASPTTADDERGRLAAAFSERDVGGVSSAYRSGAPNVVGNQLANNCLQFSFTPRIRTNFSVLNDGATGFNFPRSVQGAVLDPLSFNIFQVRVEGVGTFSLPPPSPPSLPTVLQSRNPLSVDNQLFRNGQMIPMAMPTDAAFLQQYQNLLAANFGTGTLQFVNGSIIPTEFPESIPHDITSQDAFGLEGTYDYFLAQFIQELCITSPGNLVGRYKVSENNSPIPRDRYFFNYNLFTGTPLGKDINRFTPGFEKTFFDGMSSVELRLPFASTLNGDLLVDNTLSNGTTTRLGDLQIALKSILAKSDNWLFSIGVGLAVPTADDITAELADGTPLLLIKNEAVHLQPFLGYLYAPDDSFYFQGFTQIDMDLNGDPVSLNLQAPFGTNLQRIGRLRDRTLLSNDLAVGYWLFRDSNSNISGIAPQLEVHYDQTLDKYRTLEASGLALSGAGTYSSIALTGALNVEFRQDATLTVATSVPVTDKNNRGFDWELLIQFNYRFGASVAGGTPGLAGGR